MYCSWVWHQCLLRIFLPCGRTVVATKVPIVRCTRPVKRLGTSNKNADRCGLLSLLYLYCFWCCCCCCGCYCWGWKRMYISERVTGWRSVTNKTKSVGFPMPPNRPGEAESNPWVTQPTQRRSIYRAPPWFSAGFQTCVIMHPWSPCLPQADTERNNPRPPESSTPTNMWASYAFFYL